MDNGIDNVRSKKEIIPLTSITPVNMLGLWDFNRPRILKLNSSKSKKENFDEQNN
jgi:hypothetical protein